MYATGEKVPVSVTPVGLGEKDAPATTVIVVKLEASPSSPWVTPQISDPDGESVPDNTRHSAARRREAREEARARRLGGRCPCSTR